MLDLLLLDLLGAPTLDVASLVPRLEEAARARVDARVPFVGALGPCLAHPDARLRRAALGALAGFSTRFAVVPLVAALDDPEPEVRAAATEALRASSLSAPARFFHALYHPSPDVRARAVGGAWPAGVSAFTLPLLADPACRDELLARFAAPSNERPAPHVELSMLSTLLELAGRASLPPALVRALVLELDWGSAAPTLRASLQRTPAEVAAVLEGDPPAEPGAAPGRDVLDGVVEASWVPLSDGLEPDALFRRLRAQAGAWPSSHRRRLAASILVTRERRGGPLPASAGALLAATHPPLLGRSALARDERRSAALSLSTQAPRLRPDALGALLRLDLVRDADGRLDLEVLGALLHCADQHPYARVVDALGEGEIVATLAEDLRAGGERAVAFLGLTDDSRRGRAWLLARVAEEAGADLAEVRALVLLATPIDKLRLAELSPEDAARVAVALVDVTRRTRREVGAKKVRALAPLLAELAARPALAREALERWLVGAPEEHAYGLSVLGALGVHLSADAFVGLARSLDAPRLRLLLRALAACPVFPHGKELALAHALDGDDDPEVAAWAAQHLPEPAPPPRPAYGAPARALDEDERRAILAATDDELAEAVEPCLAAPTFGLARLLAARPAPAAPSAEVCAALVGSHDPLDEVDREVARFGGAGLPFLEALDAAVCASWEREPNLPPIAHALLHRWERHAFAFADAALAPGLDAALRTFGELRAPALRGVGWDALAGVLDVWRYRDRARIAPIASAEAVTRLTDALPTDVGEAAARMLVALASAGALGDGVNRILERLPDCAEPVRRLLAPLVDARGLAPARVRAPRGSLDETLRAEVRAATDLDRLAGLARSPSGWLAEEAFLRLAELGEAGAARALAALLGGAPHAADNAASVGHWGDGPSVEAARAATEDEALGPELRFRLALALGLRGDRALLDVALALARRPAAQPWFGPEDWTALRALAPGEHTLALALATSPHPHAYRRALEHLLEQAAPEVPRDLVDAVRAFLACGTDRADALRVRAARWLWVHAGDLLGLPLLLLATRAEPAAREAFAAAPPELAERCVRSLLLAGPGGEDAAITLLSAPGVAEGVLHREAERVLLEASTPAARAWATGIARGRARAEKLSELARAFAWGIRAGRELTGRLFTIEMTSDDALGWTRLTESRVFVTPLPIFRKIPHGRAIVEGLVLHELGHQRWHRDEASLAAWKQAEREGLHGLLNIVADEHLERNLRRIEPDWGDRLKHLGAWAFLHGDKEVQVRALLDVTGAAAFEALTSTTLAVARRDGAVRVGSGELLRQLERAGRSFPRFFRALRMGLGDRWDDPKVREGLRLCQGLKDRTLPELLDLARALRALFGAEAALATVGALEATGDSVESQIHGEGITREELEREIQRVLDPGRRDRAEAAGGPPGRSWLNVSPDEAFDAIDVVVRLPRDPVKHATYARRVAPAARRLRAWFEALGLRLEPQRGRLQGRRFDRTRALAVVTRGDPHMLVAREARLRTDLFLGVAVDCSGSMQTRGNIEKARLFAVLLAEAVRGLPGVDLRVLGFDDHAMYDAGDADASAAASLEVRGGNNDAGALAHLAGIARASRRRAKLLVMISDGLPTECSVAALRGLVRRLARAGMCCAQVAVQPLAERCFDHYLELTDADPTPAVARFGAIMAGLVGKALRA